MSNRYSKRSRSRSRRGGENTFQPESQNPVDKIGSSIKGALGGIGDGFKGAANDVQDAADDAKDNIDGAVNNAKSGVDGAVNGAKVAPGNAVNAVKAAPSNFGHFFGGIIDKAKSLVSGNKDQPQQPLQSGGYKPNNDYGIASNGAPVKYTATAMPNKWIGGKRRKSKKTKKSKKSKKSRKTRRHRKK